MKGLTMKASQVFLMAAVALFLSTVAHADGNGTPSVEINPLYRLELINPLYELFFD